MNQQSASRIDQRDIDDERLARIAWSRLAERNDTAAQDLVADQGALAALTEVVAGYGPARWQRQVSDVDPSADMAAVQKIGGRVLIPSDEEWPSGLQDLGPAAPFCLWVRGPLTLNTATTKAAAIVGARASSPYGEQIATLLAAGSADRGITVVAGAAYGIDSAAHHGALSARGRSLAVLACGVDRPYPRRHERLIERIAERGAVISETPPGSAPSRQRFLARNQVIAALSTATVVVEAAHRSPAIDIASHAARLARPVAAVPGPVTSALSAGCHTLLRDGAVCLTSSAELEELLETL